MGVWIEAQIALPLTQMTCVPQFSKDHKSGNKMKIEMNIRDIFQRGKAIPLEVGSFQVFCIQIAPFILGDQVLHTYLQSAPAQCNYFWGGAQERKIKYV